MRYCRRKAAPSASGRSISHTFIQAHGRAWSGAQNEHGQQKMDCVWVQFKGLVLTCELLSSWIPDYATPRAGAKTARRQKASSHCYR